MKRSEKLKNNFKMVFIDLEKAYVPRKIIRWPLKKGVPGRFIDLVRVCRMEQGLVFGQLGERHAYL